MPCPRTFFDFNDAYFRLSEVASINMDESAGERWLVVILRNGIQHRHRDWQGSARMIERRLLDAIRAVEG